MSSFLSSFTAVPNVGTAVPNVGTAVDNYLSLTFYFSYPVVLSHLCLHINSIISVLSELHHSTTASLFHTQKSTSFEKALNLRYRAVLRCCLLYAHLPSLASNRVPLHFLGIPASLLSTPGSNIGPHATWLMPHIDLTQWLWLKCRALSKEKLYECYVLPGCQFRLFAQ